MDAPEQMPHEFADAWNKKDANQLSELFAKDADFVNVVGLWWHDRESIRKAHDYGLRVIFNESSLRVGRTKKRMLSEDFAVIHARMTLNGQSALASHETPAKRQNLFTFVMGRQASGWICLAAHNTDIVPGKETNLADENGELTPVDYRS